VDAEVRPLRPPLHRSRSPEKRRSDFKSTLNPHSLEVVTAKCEPSLKDAKPELRYQFERLAYLLVAGDVKRGRERLNFSDWPRALPERAAKRLERISEEVDYKDMPPAKYTLLHPEARLTAGQREQLIHWADQEAARLKATGTRVGRRCRDAQTA
jgi:hypothetical protein